MTREVLPYKPLSTEANKKRDNRKFLRTVALGTAIGLASIQGISAISRQIEDGKPTEALPTPTTPIEISPLTPIEQVPLVSEGSVKITYLDNSFNNYLLEVEKATVVAIKKDEEGKITDFAVTVKGEKITRSCNQISINGGNELSCDISGATLWFNVTKHTAVSVSVNDGVSISEKGSDALGKTLKLGNVISYIGAGTGYLEGSNFGNLETVQKNLHSLNNLNEKVGEKLLRANRSFSFVAGNVSI